MKFFGLNKELSRLYLSSISTRICMYVFTALVLTALLAPIIANDKPLFISVDGKWFFPAFSIKKNIELNDPIRNKIIINIEQTDWKNFYCDKIIFAPIVWSPGTHDYVNADYVAPGQQQVFFQKGIKTELPVRFKHWLGTDKLGRDVLAGLIHGTRTSLTIGLFAMLIASILGIALGAVAGYFGNYGVSASRASIFMVLIGIIPAYFYSFQLRENVLQHSLENSTVNFLLQFLVSLFLFFMIMVLFYVLGKILKRIPFMGHKVFVKVDSIISRFIEVLISLPLLILIITIAAVTKPTILNLILIIGLTFWTDIARLTRAEFLKIRNLEYIEAARALGYHSSRIIFKHALPNAIAPALTALAFGIASAILAESALSFLGVGVPQNAITWGSLLAQGRENFQAWWLVIFPGLAIFITVTICNLMGDKFRETIDVKMK